MWDETGKYKRIGPNCAHINTFLALGKRLRSRVTQFQT